MPSRKDRFGYGVTIPATSAGCSPDPNILGLDVLWQSVRVRAGAVGGRPGVPWPGRWLESRRRKPFWAPLIGEKLGKNASPKAISNIIP